MGGRSACVSADGRLHVWLARPDDVRDDALLARYRTWLSDEERARADRYLFAHDRRLFTVAHALLRSTLSRYADVAPGQWQFSTEERGRPRIAANDPESARAASRLGFSLSHTPGLVACVVGDEVDCGVDVEELGRVKDPRALAARYFSRSECEDLDALGSEAVDERFLEFWTVKEAYLKARGLGLALPLDRFRLTRSGDGDAALAFESPIDDRAEDWQVEVGRAGTGHVLAVVARLRDGRRREIVQREVRPEAP